MFRKTTSVLGLLLLVGGLSPGLAGAEEGQFFPVFVFRTGPFAPSGIPSANASREFPDS